MSFFRQHSLAGDSRLDGMKIMQSQVPDAATTATFEVRAINPGVLSRLRVADDAGHAPRLVTEGAGGSPLRCCLRVSKPGERIALVSYAPLRAWADEARADPGPYDEVGPVFIHPEPCDGPQGTGYPDGFIGSQRMFRAYRADGSILLGRLASADEVGDQAAAHRLLGEIFTDPEVAIVHARAVEFGCFTFEVRRAAA
jgi:Protein of unknown function (DUF1203)